MHFSSKWFGWLSAAAILTYMAVVAVGLFMPLQNDEVSGLFLNHRAWADGRTVIGLLPQCSKDYYSQPLPLIWYLPAYASYLTYDLMGSPLWIRIAGIAQFAVWLALWTAIAMRLFAVPRRLWWAALAVLLTFLGWDALPLALLVNRPEQALLIGAGTAVALALYAEELRGRAVLKIASTLWMVFAVMNMHAAHAKAITLLPLELAMYCVFLQGVWRSRAVTVVGAAVIAAIALQSYQVEMLRTSCADAPDIKEFFQSLYLPIQTLWQAPGTFALSAMKNIVASSVADFYLDIYFQVGRIWIPASLHPLAAPADFLVRVLNVDGWILHFAFLVMACWVGCRATVLYLRKAEGAPHGRHVPVWLGLSTLLIFIGAICMLVTEGIFYSVSLMIPMVLLAALFAVGLNSPEPWNKPIYARGIIILFIGAILNQSLLLVRYGEFIHAPDPEAYAALPMNHKTLSATFGYGKKRNDILAAAGHCGIDTYTNAKHLVVDDTTYFAFSDTFQPFFFADSTGICCHKGMQNPETGKPWFNVHDYAQLLRRYDSDGVIAQCKLFPDTLRPYTHEHNGFCCIPKSTLSTLK